MLRLAFGVLYFFLMRVRVIFVVALGRTCGGRVCSFSTTRLRSNGCGCSRLTAWKFGFGVRKETSCAWVW